MNKNDFAENLESRIFDINIDYAIVTNLCYEAEKFGFGDIQVFPSMVSLCKETLSEGSKVRINALISYPHGGFTANQKAFEAKDAVEKGAAGVEVMINTREAKSKNYDYIYEEMKAVKEAVGKDITVKFIIEIEFLLADQITGVCQAACNAGIDYISTSTGLYNTLDENKKDIPLVTSVDEIKELKGLLGNKVKIQAQGNILNAVLAKELIKAGADNISTRDAKKIIFEYKD